MPCRPQSRGRRWRIRVFGNMERLEIHQFPYGDDNYGVLLHCPHHDQTAVVDAGDSEATDAALTARGWSLDQIWITHHHGDHTAGLADLKARHDATIIGPAKSAEKFGNFDVKLDDGDHFDFAGRQIDVIATPGHTLDMLNFHLRSEKLVFTGDTLFALGCGRLFEGNAAMMWQSLEKLLALSDETVVYCSHEYTAANARFAVTIDPDNAALRTRANDVEGMRRRGLETVPTTIELEKATNPFLRADDPAIRSHLGMKDATDAAVFAEIRRRKDSF